MHEFAIGEELVRAVLEEQARVTPGRLTGVRVVVGALRQVIPQHLAFAYEVLTRDTPADESTLEIVQEPVTATCRACGWHGQLDDLPFLCPQCDALDLERHNGMELYLDRLEVEYDTL